MKITVEFDLENEIDAHKLDLFMQSQKMEDAIETMRRWLRAVRKYRGTGQCNYFRKIELNTPEEIAIFELIDEGFGNILAQMKE